MSRVIKFRAWTGKEMQYNVMAGFLGAFYVQGISDADSACMSEFNTIYDKDTPIMQFTGLLDKNGNEIYEGDICNGRYGMFKVRFIDGGFRPFCGDTNAENNMERVSVIGNIHENPELI